MEIKLEIIFPIICLFAASALAKIAENGPNDLEGAAATSSASVVETLPDTISEDITYPYSDWPKQVIQVVRKAEIERELTEAEVPSKTPAQPIPFNFVNKFTLADFNIQDFKIGSNQVSEVFPGSFSTGKDMFQVVVKRALPGFENLLYQEAQIQKALESVSDSFPQVIYYDGKNLISTTLCTTWYEQTYTSFYAGGLALKDGFNMMHQMLDILKDMHTAGFVHRDISPYNMVYGCNWRADLYDAPFRLSSSGKLYLREFGAGEYLNESVLNKYYNAAGGWDFASIGSMKNEEATFAQDVESLGYVLLYGLNGGWVTWGYSPDPQYNPTDNIEKKLRLDLDTNLKRLKGGATMIAIAKQAIGKYFEIVREHIENRPKELLDYDVLKACFNIEEAIAEELASLKE